MFQPRSLALLLMAAPCLMAQTLTPAKEQISKINEGSKVDNMLPNQRAFLNLTEEQRKEFVENFREANRLFQQKRIFESLEALTKAENIFTDSPEVINLKGSCYVEMRSFDKALDCFKKAATLSKHTTNIDFNIAEVYFVTKQWAKAAEKFKTIIPKIAENQAELTKLSEFKLMLCNLKLGKTKEAAELAEKYDYLDDSPYYYYAQASMAYEQDNLLEAEQWLGRANRIFRNPAILSPWQDTIVEFGYIKSFYGGEGEDVEP